MKVSIKYISKKQPKPGSFFHHHIVNVRISMQCLRILRQISRDLIFIGTFEVKLTYFAAVWFPQLLLFIPPRQLLHISRSKSFPYYKWIGASDILKGKEVEVRHLCPGRLKCSPTAVSQPVVPGCPPCALCTWLCRLLPSPPCPHTGLVFSSVVLLGNTVTL